MAAFTFSLFAAISSGEGPVGAGGGSVGGGVGPTGGFSGVGPRAGTRRGRTRGSTALSLRGQRLERRLQAVGHLRQVVDPGVGTSARSDDVREDPA